MRSEEKRQQTKTVQDFGKVKKKTKKYCCDQLHVALTETIQPIKASFQLVCDDRSVLHRLFLVHSWMYWGLKGV